MTETTANRGVEDHLPEAHSMGRSSAGLLVGKSSQMALGFVFWLVAARVAATTDVGLATGALSGIMIVTQVSLLGIGAAVILRIPALGRRDAMSLSDSALTLVALSSVAGGVGYVLFLMTTSPFLRELISKPAVAALVVMTAVAGTLAVCLDQISTGLGRGGMAAPRGVTSGLVGVACLALLATALDDVNPETIIAAYGTGLTVSVVLGLVLLRRMLGYLPRPRIRHPQSAGMLRDGLPNQILTLTERVPALLLPVLISGYVSPSLGAYWYPVWMMAWAVLVAPVMVGLAQFAADVRAGSDLSADIRMSLRWSLLLGGSVALAVAVAAEPLLSLLGDEYATNGGQALRVLLLALPGVAVIQAYFAACRAHRQLKEAIPLGLGVGIVACTSATVAAALTSNLMAVSIAWVASQSIGGMLAAWRLRRLVRAVEVGVP